MPPNNQFRLFGQRRFLPFYLTQFSGAFNDNLYKNALLLLITYSAGSVMGLSVNLVVNLAAFLFILPFFLFSGIAGQIADRYEMSRIIRLVKLAEIGIMGLAAIGLWFGWYGWLLVLLFLMGTQSTFFGPVKYAILPRVLADDELVGGNGLVGMGTFVAILLGTIAAGLIMGFEMAAQLTAIGVIAMAILGYLAACQVPYTGEDNRQLRIRFRPMAETWHLMVVAAERRPVLLAILAISWFWFLGAAYLTQFPNFAKTDLAGDETVVTLLLALFTVGISIGSVLCERLTKHRITLVPVPWGALGLTLFGVDVFFAVPMTPVASSWQTFFLDADYFRVLVDLVGIGVCGGLFIVPLYAFIQHETPAPKRARIIAALNVINALFMVASALAGMVMLGGLGRSIPEFFLILSVTNAVVLLVVWRLRRRSGAHPVDK
ncbi:phospholipid/glycerol acyltransferase [Marinobacter santoriniensis NKSG1]|uniref:Phospholipid/glycerol acyltransferase n=1 Tax=Marinobacter santoriniensis NKSG1 TaxID=1288826 RepID=M7CMZ1_9GAMM|nr:MFS transporter [Marinobacter santoriniensis]EMP54539.1 phospholipid/glycerol acyltransferase [Marinobacter santoriniensis NKSG1]